MVSGSKKAGGNGARMHTRRKRPRGRPGGGSAAIIAAVLDAVLDELGMRGYARLSVEEVALRAGVNKTSIYRRWPTKSELVRAALLALREDDAPLPDTGALGTDLLELLRRKTAKMSVPRGRSLVRALMADEDPELAKLTRSIHERSTGPAPVFERAILRGELHPRTDTALLLEVVCAPLYHRAFILQEQVDDAFLTGVIDTVLRGALAPRAEGRAPAAPQVGTAAKRRRA